MQVIFYSKYGIFWFHKQGFLYLGASDFWFKHRVFDFEQGVFDSKHTWNEKLEILAWNWVWEHLNISYIWIFINMHEFKACPWKKKLHKKEFFSFLEKEIKRPCFESHTLGKNKKISIILMKSTLN
jgi:hypothetical protein